MRQASHILVKVRALNEPMLAASTPVDIEAVWGRPEVRGLAGGVCGASRLVHQGKQGVCAAPPWLTQSLQKPQSPSLHTSHRSSSRLSGKAAHAEGACLQPI